MPDELHRELQERAARTGQSLSAYLLSQIRELAERPTMEEMLECLSKRPPVKPSIDPVDIIRAHRDRE